MQAVLLAAGQSSRFSPFTHLPHKSFIKMLGKAILEHTLDSLKNVNITDVILVANNNDAFQQFVAYGKTIGVQVTIVILPEPLGMGAALLAAKEYLQDTFFLLSAYHMDVIDVAEDLIKKQKNPATIVLVGQKNVQSTSYGYMKVDGDTVLSIFEKPQTVTPDMHRIIGIYLLNKSFVATLERVPDNHYNFELALDAYAKTKNVHVVLTQIKPVTLKYAWDLLRVKDYLLSKMNPKISSSATVSPTAVITGNVVIEDGVKIMEHVCIKGPAYVGKNCVLGNNVVLRNGVSLGENVVIGANMEMKDTVAMDNTTTHAGFIGDSVIGKNGKIAGFVSTANVRLDRKEISVVIKNEKVDSGLSYLGTLIGDDVVFGTRVTTMPGVIIGSNSIIGPSTTVMKNIPENTRYYTKFQEIVEERISHDKK